MSCCGKKRSEWLRDPRAATPAEPAVPARPDAAKAPGLFRYTGSRQLIVKGVHSGTLYRFTLP